MSWDEILGQDAVVGLLKASAERPLASGAYLLIGPDGIGKRMLGRIFAKAILCTQKKKNPPCGRCKSCRQFESGNHPDFLPLELSDEETQIKIGDPDSPEPGTIRHLERQIYRKSVQSPNRAVFIPRVERMNTPATNAFLKTLEEPPAGTAIILTTSRPSDVLPTLLSRCIRLPLSPVQNEDIVRLLVERHGVDDTEARRRAVLACGCPGRALFTRPRQRVFDEFISDGFTKALSKPHAGALQQAMLAAVKAACEAESIKAEGHAQRNMISDLFPLVALCLRHALAMSLVPERAKGVPEAWRPAAEMLSRGGSLKLEAASAALTKASRALSIYVRPSLCMRHIARRLAACARVT